jgi:HEAT repeat protein
MELVEDPASGGNMMAVRVLGYWDEPHIVQKLLRMAEDSTLTSALHEEAIEALCRLEAPEAMDLLIRAMQHERLDEVTRWRRADALGVMGNRGALGALRRVAAGDANKTLRERAQEAIESIEHPSLDPILRGELADLSRRLLDLSR